MSIKTLYEKDGTTLITVRRNVGFTTIGSGTILNSNTEYTATESGWVSVNYSGPTEENIEIQSPVGNPQVSLKASIGKIQYPVHSGDKYSVVYPTGGGGIGKVPPKSLNQSNTSLRGCAE